MADIAERREIRVAGDDSHYVFTVEPDRGRLAIRQEDGDDVCEIRVDDSDQLIDFMEGLRRALAPFAPADLGGERRGAVERNAPSTRTDVAAGHAESTVVSERGADEPDRDEMIARARNRNANAFRAWTPDEERRITEGFRAGRGVAELADELGRSQRAIEMRLAKLGVTPHA